MRFRVGVLVPVTFHVILASAQGLVPFTTATDRFMVFDKGRFVELEPRKPRQVAPAGDKLVYVDDLGALKVYYERGDTRRIRVDGPVELFGSGAAIVFTSGDRLGTVKAGAPMMLSNEASDIGVSDSLIVWSDGASFSLDLWWNGNVYPIADRTTDTLQWWLGSNTFAWYERVNRTISLFYRGAINEVADSCDMALASCGGDVAAWWDDGAERFMMMDHGAIKVLDEFRPVDIRTGQGVLAYTSATLRFHVHQHGTNHTVLDHRPTNYWVQDSVVTYVDRGYFWTVVNGEPKVVAEYVPEQWSVHQGSITHLNLNREIHSYHQGERQNRSKGDAAIERYEPHGDALLYRDRNGAVKVAWNGSVWIY